MHVLLGTFNKHPYKYRGKKKQYIPFGLYIYKDIQLKTKTSLPDLCIETWCMYRNRHTFPCISIYVLNRRTHIFLTLVSVSLVLFLSLYHEHLNSSKRITYHLNSHLHWNPSILPKREDDNGYTCSCLDAFMFISDIVRVARSWEETEPWSNLPYPERASPGSRSGWRPSNLAPGHSRCPASSEPFIHQVVLARWWTDRFQGFVFKEWERDANKKRNSLNDITHPRQVCTCTFAHPLLNAPYPPHPRPVFLTFTSSYTKAVIQLCEQTLPLMIAILPRAALFLLKANRKVIPLRASTSRGDDALYWLMSKETVVLFGIKPWKLLNHKFIMV